MNDRLQRLKQFASLETARLRLRTILLGDAPHVADLIEQSLDNFKQYLPWAAGLTNRQDIDALVMASLQAYINHPSVFSLPLVVEEKASGLMIGRAGINPTSNPCRHHYDLGVWLHVDYQNQGYASEIMQGLADYIFIILGAPRIQTVVMTKNLPAQAVLKKIGWVDELVLTDAYVDSTGQRADLTVFSCFEQSTKLSPRVTYERHQIDWPSTALTVYQPDLLGVIHINYADLSLVPMSLSSAEHAYWVSMANTYEYQAFSSVADASISQPCLGSQLGVAYYFWSLEQDGQEKGWLWLQTVSLESNTFALKYWVEEGCLPKVAFILQQLSTQLKKRLTIQRLQLIVPVSHMPAQEACHHLNFQEEGRLGRYYMDGDKAHDAIIYRI